MISMMIKMIVMMRIHHSPGEEPSLLKTLWWGPRNIAILRRLGWAHLATPGASSQACLATPVRPREHLCPEETRQGKAGPT